MYHRLYRPIYLQLILLIFSFTALAGEMMEIYRVAGEKIVPDGILSEWPAYMFNPLSDSENKWAAAADKDFLHFAVIVKDSTSEFTDTATHTSVKNDAIQIYLHTSDTRSGFTVTRWEKTQQTVVLPLYPDSLDSRWVVSQIQPNSDGYTCEVSIARRALPDLDKAGASFSLQIVVVDLAAGVIQNIYSLNNKLTGWQEAVEFQQFTIPE